VSGPENPTAFPFQETSAGTAEPCYSMDLRDWIAGQLLPTLIRVSPHGTPFGEDHPENNRKYAAVAYVLADAMLAEREKGK
jgi:hypothetical protein